MRTRLLLILASLGVSACGGIVDSGNSAANPNVEGNCAIPAGAGLEDVSNPRTVIGNGTPASCTSAAVVAAVAKGGVITFSCGPDPLTITLAATAKVFNDTGPRIIIDGGNKITLDGGSARRILYMNTCDEAQHWTTSNCNLQDYPQLTVQNLSFVNGNASTLGANVDGGPGGGAIYVRGGQFKIFNSRFSNNRAIASASDEGGGAVRVVLSYDQYNHPTYITNSTFGGSGHGNTAANGGGLSGLFSSFTITNALFAENSASGSGGNDGQGGSGGGIYMDGNDINLRLCGTRLEGNHINAYGRGIFYVSNNKVGTLDIDHSVIRNNTDSDSWGWDVVIPQVAFHPDMPYTVTESDIPPVFSHVF